MQLLLTDRLTCPRCGPEFGLILLADDMADRRVRRGVLGCPNCRDSFPIREGFADLRAPPRDALGVGLAGDGSGTVEPEESARLVALLGLTRGPGVIALVGQPARYAADLADSVDDIEVVAVDDALAGWSEASGVSRIVSAPGLPFFSRVLRGVVVDGRLGRSWIAEACRVVAPMSRVVVEHAPSECSGILEEGGLSVLAQEAETVVAARG